MAKAPRPGLLLRLLGLARAFPSPGLPTGLLLRLLRSTGTVLLAVLRPVLVPVTVPIKIARWVLHGGLVPCFRTQPRRARSTCLLAPRTLPPAIAAAATGDVTMITATGTRAMRTI